MENLAPKRLLASDLYFDNEAEEGSENEEHDDVIKKINREEEDSEDSKENIEGLIASDIEDEDEKDKDELKNKFFKDMIKKDYEEIKQVIKGPPVKKRYRDLDQEDEDYISMGERFKKFQNINTNSSDFGFLNARTLLMRSNSNTVGAENSDDYDNDELNFMKQSQENSKIKKFTDKQFDLKSITERIKENEKILEDVIFLNGQEDSNSISMSQISMHRSMSMNNILKKSSSTNISDFNQGFKFNQNSNNLLFLDKNQKSGEFSSPGLSSQITTPSSGLSGSMGFKFGGGVTQKNSFLHALKNDKTLKFTKNEEFKLKEESAVEKKVDKVMSIFSANVNRIKPNMGLATLFTKQNAQSKANKMNDLRSKIKGSNKESEKGNEKGKTMNIKQAMQIE